MSRKPTPAPSPIAELRANLDQLIEQTTSTTLSAPRRRTLEKEIRGVIEELGSFLNTLDPIRQPSAVFDPSNPKVVGRFVSLALVAQQRHPLAEIPRISAVCAHQRKRDANLRRPGRARDQQCPYPAGAGAAALWASFRPP